jgi:glycerophosphoryl diester phosphodiesterase
VRLPAISAHRGGPESDLPDPTWEVYEKSLTSGAEYVEIDIRRTGDGEFVVYHDRHVSPKGPLVSSATYKELCGAAGYEVPRVREVMGLVAGKAIGHLDLKDAGSELPVIAMALDLFGPGDFVATTLEDESIRRIKQAYPQVRTALALGKSSREIHWYRRLPTRMRELYPLRRIRGCGADWAAINHRLARLGALRVCGAEGIGTMVWTVDETPLMDAFLADSRVNVLISNYPRLAVQRRSLLRG